MIKLLHGDCLELMKDIPDKSIDMILCDLPYGTTACKWDVIIPFEPLWKEYKRIIKDRGCIALFGSEPFSSYLRMSNIKNYKYDWIWDKRKAGNFALGNRQPLKTHEIISVFSLKNHNYYPQKILLEKPQTRHLGKKSINRKDGFAGGIGNEIKYGKDYEPNKKLPISIQEFKKDNYKNNLFHPTQKPVTLLEYLIKTYTLENETVLDNCMGSGSTGVACINTKRNFIGIEKDVKYFEIAKKRIEEHLTPTSAACRLDGACYAFLLR
jgi:site-specific DNA-methyltransferase (adenine-specific)